VNVNVSQHSFSQRAPQSQRYEATSGWSDLPAAPATPLDIMATARTSALLDAYA
jgi:hypothetical protein